MKILTTTQKKRIKMLVEALRSKKYKQAQHQLRLGNKYCCLGVACDLFLKTTGKGEWKKKAGSAGSADYNFIIKGSICDSYLPPKVYEWFGFRSKDPTLHKVGASKHNDDGRYFDEIADLFEARFLKEKEGKK